MRSIYQAILEQIRQDSKSVVATVVQTAGSTPQKAGSSALFGARGLMAGTVGGGMLEDEVHKIAKQALSSGISDHYYFNLDAEEGSDGAICGGEAMVLVDANPSLHLARLEEMEASLNKQEEGMLLTLVSQSSGQGRSIRRLWIPLTGTERLPDDLEGDLKPLVEAHLKSALRYGFDQLDLKTIPDHQVNMAYLEHFKPLPKLIIVGGGHIGKALAHLGSLLEFEVSVLDDRQEYANKAHIPDADHLLVGNVGNALLKLKPGAESYIVIVTRGHAQDGEALRACIASDAAYIGMIGSKQKVGTMKKRFLREGWATREQWSALHTPIGLPIGSQTVQEIAVSIAAQLVEVRKSKNAYHGK